VLETSALQVGPLCAGNHSKARHTPVVALSRACSDLWPIHQRKCKNGKKEVSIVA
jgi:hypothetical protein